MSYEKIREEKELIKFAEQVRSLYKLGITRDRLYEF